MMLKRIAGISAYVALLTYPFWVEGAVHLLGLLGDKLVAMKTSDVVISVFTCGLLIVAMVQAWITQRTANIALTSAKAAEHTVAIMKDTAERQLRAYVFVNKAGIIPLNGAPAALIEFANKGQTPAYKVRVIANSQAFAPNSLELRAHDFSKNAGSGPISESQIGPGVLMDFPVPCHLTALDIAQIKSGAKELYVWGKLTYEDAYGIPRITTFRLVSDNLTRIAPAEHGNEAN